MRVVIANNYRQYEVYRRHLGLKLTDNAYLDDVDQLRSLGPGVEVIVLPGYYYNYDLDTDFWIEFWRRAHRYQWTVRYPDDPFMGEGKINKEVSHEHPDD